MSEETVNLVRRIFAEGGAGSIEVLIPYLPEDVVWIPPVDWHFNPEYHGVDGARELIEVFTQNFEDYGAEIHEIRDAGDSVVVLMWQTATIKGTDAHIRQAVGGIYSDFRDGDQIGRFEYFSNWEDTLAAAGFRDS